jgi:hypothetical protein
MDDSSNAKVAQNVLLFEERTGETIDLVYMPLSIEE